MIHAYVMLNVETGTERIVLERLKTVDGVEEAYISYGVYDIILRVKANTMQDLKEEITRKIRTTNQVLSTLTLIQQ